jgi:transcriptional regulator with XRE-family HTH domain
VSLTPEEQQHVLSVVGVADQRKYSRENLSRNLKCLLGAHGLSGKEAAALTGVSANTMSGWLTGKTEPSLSSMEKLAEVFEVDVFKLLGQYTGAFLHEEVSDVIRWARVEEKLRAVASRPAGESGVRVAAARAVHRPAGTRRGKASREGSP